MYSGSNKGVLYVPSYYYTFWTHNLSRKFLNNTTIPLFGVPSRNKSMTFHNSCESSHPIWLGNKQHFIAPKTFWSRARIIYLRGIANFKEFPYALLCSCSVLDQLWDSNQSPGNVSQQELLTIQLDLANKHVIKVNLSQTLPCFVVNVDYIRSTSRSCHFHALSTP